MGTRAIGPGIVSVAIALVLSGCAGVAAAPVAESAPPPASEAAAAPSLRPTSAVEVPVGAATPAPPRTAVPPVRLRLEAIGVDMPVVPVGVEAGGFMELPTDPARAGWYRFGADPSSADGNVVISAHVDAPQYPIGPLSRLRELRGGERVTILDRDGRAHRYRIERVTAYPKQQLPVDVLFAREGSKRLVLITCGGAFDRTTGRYADNIVAVATPLR